MAPRRIPDDAEPPYINRDVTELEILRRRRLLDDTNFPVPGSIYSNPLLDRERNFEEEE